MPFVIDRRAFLKTTLAAGLAARAHADTAAPSRWALVSDTHCPADPKDVYRGFYSHENLRKAARQVADSPAQFCAIAGDLARLTGKPEDYETLRELLRPIADRMPVGFALGNHDHRANFLKTFASPSGARQAVGRKHVLTFEWTDLRAVFLDSLLETNVTPGQLGTAQRQWLVKYIGGDPRPALLFVHHDFRDQDGSLVDADKFLQAVAPLRQVKAIFYGHSHEYGVEARDGVHLVNVPSTAYNFRDQDPVGWLDMTLSKTGAELTLRASAGNTKLDGTKATLRWR
jgi:3',5'-cyclic AMP phosphodiesterase CpdA